MSCGLRRSSGRQGGFTLLELLSVMVLLGITAAVVVTLDGQLFAHRDDRRALLLAAPCIQSCAERLLAQRQATGGYAGLTATACAAVADTGLSLRNANGVLVSSCAGSAFCTATIACTGLRPLTLQFHDY